MATEPTSKKNASVSIFLPQISEVICTQTSKYNWTMVACCHVFFFTQLSRNLKTVPVIQLTYLYQTCLSLACMSQNWTVTSYCLPVPSEVHQQKSFLICLGPLTDRREHTKVKWIKICHVYIPSLKARFLCSHYLCTSLNIFMLF